MVNRRVMAHDLRRGLISITPVGLALLAKIAPLSQASFAQIRQLYGPERLDQLSEMLYELERSLRKPAGASSRGPARLGRFIRRAMPGDAPVAPALRPRRSRLGRSRGRPADALAC